MVFEAFVSTNFLVLGGANSLPVQVKSSAQNRVPQFFFMQIAKNKRILYNISNFLQGNQNDLQFVQCVLSKFLMETRHYIVFSLDSISALRLLRWWPKPKERCCGGNLLFIQSTKGTLLRNLNSDFKT